MLDDPGFVGRVVSIWSREPARGAVLEDVSVRQLHQRAFLVGRLADDGKGEKDPRVGATFWFPVDEVLMLTVFADVEGARAAYAAHEKPAAGNAPNKPGWRLWS